MLLADVIGYIGYAFIIIGLILLTKKQRLGFALRFVGGFLWVIVGILTGLTSAIIGNIIFMIVDASGWWTWRKKN